ncbi:hypothetical protein [Halapricum hydrolyticum]|uniref:Uncharacterized protein n=1 Tax=Halapricum hydrolyticum TaxID=2979991 RepID=A0AAE3ICS2_9EURY|nr:hypothetical protein [Halapricum hydrolyticum]MCU4717123.1 hypothetical protein [Halapricum hydrolyticum]MCU4726050.1 hypothetical protein [Halapricum hydrolyticum]
MADTVSRAGGPKQVLQMGIMGYVIALGVALLLLPLLPIFIALKLIDVLRRPRSPEPA